MHLLLDPRQLASPMRVLGPPLQGESGTWIVCVTLQVKIVLRLGIRSTMNLSFLMVYCTGSYIHVNLSKMVRIRVSAIRWD